MPEEKKSPFVVFSVVDVVLRVVDGVALTVGNVVISTKVLKVVRV